MMNRHSAKFLMFDSEEIKLEWRRGVYEMADKESHYFRQGDLFKKMHEWRRLLSLKRGSLVHFLGNHKWACLSFEYKARAKTFNIVDFSILSKSSNHIVGTCAVAEQEQLISNMQTATPETFEKYQRAGNFVNLLLGAFSAALLNCNADERRTLVLVKALQTSRDEIFHGRSSAEAELKRISKRLMRFKCSSLERAA